MKREQYKRLVAIGVTAFCVIAASILLVFAIFQFQVLRGFAARIWRILRPFLYGFVLAYLLLPVYNFLRRQLKKLFSRRPGTEKTEKRRGLFASGIAAACTMLFFLALVTGFGFLVLPELSRSIVSIVQSAPDTGRRVIAWAERLLRDHPEIETTVAELIDRYIGDVSSWAETYVVPYVSEFVNGLSSSILVTVTETFNFLKNAVIGLIAAIYMLVNKNVFLSQGKKLTYAVLPVRYANLFLENVRFVHRTFSGFITGKLLDSLIIGIICYIFCVIVRMPYNMLVSVLIGITNVIPFFGPFIGAIPSALLILTVSPLQCVTFVIFIIILQQFDGNVLGPRIVGSAVGISSFWVMFSIIFCSGLFGFLGMLIGVPLFALLLSLVAALCRRSLAHKSLPLETARYEDLASIDPETGEPVPLPPRPKIRENPHSALARLIRPFRKKKD